MVKELKFNWGFVIFPVLFILIIIGSTFINNIPDKKMGVVTGIKDISTSNAFLAGEHTACILLIDNKEMTFEDGICKADVGDELWQSDLMFWSNYYIRK